MMAKKKKKKVNTKKKTSKKKVKVSKGKLTSGKKVTKKASKKSKSVKTVKDGIQNKCYLYNCDTKEKHFFQFAPEDLPRNRSANYSIINSPGMAYPLVQFVQGEIQDFDLSLYYNERWGDTKGAIKRVYKFLDGLLPPVKNTKLFSAPPKCKVAYGTFSCNCVVTGYNISGEERDSSGEPVASNIVVNVRRI